jgi:hypothetical protein
MLVRDNPDEKQLARILSEQKECAAYMLSDQPDKSGARAGLADWIMEEVIVRSESSKPEERRVRAEERAREIEAAHPPD